MKHRARRRAAASDNTLPAKVEPPASAVEAFSFGDPSPVLEGRDMLADVECYRNGDWYEPPLSMVGLAKSLNASVHHASAIWCKVNILASTFQPSAVLSRGDFTRLALDLLLFGNCYAERRESMTGKLLSLKPALAKYTRVGVEPGRYFFVNGWRDTYEFERDGIWHLQAPDINQEVYGVPQYVSALQSAWLNESATLFRRRYYLNGSHAGFILYMTDTASNVNDVDKLREANGTEDPGI